MVDWSTVKLEMRYCWINPVFMILSSSLEVCRSYTVATMSKAQDIPAARNPGTVYPVEMATTAAPAVMVTKRKIRWV
jgi:hypothetical protein